MQSGSSDPLPDFITGFDSHNRIINYDSKLASDANTYNLVMQVVEPVSGATSSLQI